MEEGHPSSSEGRRTPGGTGAGLPGHGHSLGTPGVFGESRAGPQGACATWKRRPTFEQTQPLPEPRAEGGSDSSHHPGNPLGGGPSRGHRQVFKGLDQESVSVGPESEDGPERAEAVAGPPSAERVLRGMKTLEVVVGRACQQLNPSTANPAGPASLLLAALGSLKCCQRTASRAGSGPSPRI